MDRLYQSSPHSVLRSAWGVRYNPPETFDHGEWHLVATFPPADRHYPHVEVHELRNPARFYRVVVRDDADRTVATLNTASGQTDALIVLVDALRVGRFKVTALEHLPED